MLHSDVTPSVSIGLVKAELTRINTRKATTSDDYPSWVTKEFAEFLCEPLTDIINTMFKQQKYPDVWKYAEVIPVPKLKSPSQCKEFRPISLLFHCGKVAEKLFAKEYKKSVLPKISSAQYAYQPGLGTTDAIIYTLENWIKQLDNRTNKAVEVIYKDFSKAFDSLQPGRLLEALQSLNSPSHITKLAMDFLNNRKQRVRVNSSTSGFVESQVGVPQGTIVGPLFWLAFINSYKPDSVDLTMYADDVTCSHPIKSASDSLLNQTVEWGLQWCQENSMTLNMTKTKGMLVTLSTNSRAPQLQTELDLVDNYKFLGVYVDNILSFNKHVDYVIDKASKRFYALLQLKRLGVSTEKLALFYVSNIRSVLVYCIASFFSQLNDKQKESLERVQSLCSKIILPNIESYSERLEVLAIPNLCAFSLEQYRCHFLRFLTTLIMFYIHSYLRGSQPIADILLDAKMFL